MLAIIIGEKGSMTPRMARRRAILLAKTLRLVSPHETVELAVFGYDDDPRELWEIAESRDYIIRFADELVKQGIPIERLLPQNQTLIKLCQAVAEGRPVATIGSREDTIREGIDDILQHQQALIRTVH